MSDSYINLTILTNDIRLESNKLSNILKNKAFKHYWFLNKDVLKIICQCDELYELKENIDKYILDVKETIHYQQDRICLEFKDKMIIYTKTGEELVFNISNITNNSIICDYYPNDNILTPTASYKIIGYDKEYLSGYEYVADKNGTIQFDEYGQAKSINIQNLHTYIYLFNETNNTYYELNLYELCSSGHKNKKCKIGIIDYDITSKDKVINNLENENIYANIVLHDYFTESIINYYYIDKSNEVYPLYEVSYDGNDDMYPNGYVKLHSFLAEK